MKRIISGLLFLLASVGLSCDAQVSIQFVTPSIVRVQWGVDGNIVDNSTGICVYQPQHVTYERSEQGSEIIYSTSDLKVIIEEAHHAVTFLDNDGHILLHQIPGSLSTESVIQERVIYDDTSAHTEYTANGQVTVRDILRRDTLGISTRFKVAFSSPGEKALYGLGSHMEDYLNLQGKTLYLTQHNLKAMVPMLCSTNGYGLLFDAGCAMKYQSGYGQSISPELEDGVAGYSMLFEAARSLDYYFIKGKTLDQVVAGYRHLTGSVSLMPRYLFGYTQSKERYKSSDDILTTLRQYRDRHVPIDMIVQDWNYWPQGWGYMKMDSRYYPDPKALADSVHAMHARLMVSIWPNPQGCPEADDFKARGMMLPHDVYDVFNPEARRLYWQYAYNEFFSRGFDAWWCDSSEPLDGDWNQMPPPINGRPYNWNDHERRWQLNKDILSDALGAERSSLYSLYHSMGIYTNQRGLCIQRCIPDENWLEPYSCKRVVNLTRSSYAGQQRYSTIVWNGDTHASWESFKRQIPAGLNYMATGNPYWTVDVGSFFTRNDGRRWFYTGDFPEGVNDDAYKEYYVRMFQWGTFLPMLRSHGSDTPREIWQFGEPGTPYYDAILRMIQLRYSHIPYLYSLAALQTFSNYTMARLLAFDFADDEQVLDIKDQYMLGDFLVCPVTDPLSRTTTRRLYLPKGTRWTDFWTRVTYEGGVWLDYDLLQCNASSLQAISQFPLFVRAGSIIPTTEVTEYSDAQHGKPIFINIYPGADATFSLYEDEGDNYMYELYHRSTIDLSWDDAHRTLTIGRRSGSYQNMPHNRTFIIQTPSGQKTITYKGRRTKVRTP